jgi:ATP-dependent helicase/nuclease subunit B
MLQAVTDTAEAEASSHATREIGVRQIHGPGDYGIELPEWLCRCIEHVGEQAVAAALILRECLETPGRTGCLVTPDRQLARRVKVELRRWNITINDSAGEPLVRHGGASLLNLLLEALLQNFAGEPLAALLRHDLALFGCEAAEARHHASLIEIALLRGGTGAPEIGKLSHALRLAAEAQKKQLTHLLLRAVTSEQWESTVAHGARIAAVLEPLLSSSPNTLAEHLDRFAAAGEAIAGEAFWLGEGGEVLREAFDLLKTESRFLST